MDSMIAEILCGPDREGAQMVAPKRLKMMKHGKAFAVFSTKDLGIQDGDTQLVCRGTLEPDGTAFMGTSNSFRIVSRDRRDRKDKVRDEDRDDDNDRHERHDDKRDRHDD